MKTLKEQLEAVRAALGSEELKLEVAGNRWQANHDKAHAEHKKQKEAEHDAVHYKREGHPKVALAASEHARRCEHRAIMAHRRAEHFVGKAKEYAAGVHHLKESLATKEGKLKELEIKHGPHISPANPNKVDGGTAIEKLEFAMRYSDVHSSLYYSQTGREDIHHGLNGPPSGARFDCSSWFTSIYWSCDLPDPNGTEYKVGEVDFTGSLGEGGKPIAEHELDTGDAILYGVAPFHHIEMKIGKMSVTNKTMGHGTSDTNEGIVALLPGPRAYRRYPKS